MASFWCIAYITRKALFSSITERWRTLISITPCYYSICEMIIAWVNADKSLLLEHNITFWDILLVIHVLFV